MKLSIIVPAYNVALLIHRALDSIYFSDCKLKEWGIEVIVVDDGSEDGEDLRKVLSNYPDVKLIVHNRNMGMCAARNTGILSSVGDYVTLLDADDEYVEGWYEEFIHIIEEWPDDVNVCFTVCVDENGKPTCREPEYCGYLTAEDYIKQKYSGEYNPIFRGEYIRKERYIDLGIRKSCGLLSYLSMLRQNPFWISSRVQRVYRVGRSGSVTSGWLRQEKSRESYLCFMSVLEMHGDFIRSISPLMYHHTVNKMLIYKLLAGQGRDFRVFIRNLSFNGLFSSFATFLLLLGGAKTATFVLSVGKRTNLLRRFG